MFDERDRDAARRLLADCAARRQRVAVAESCTGGLLGALLTAIPGSSTVFDCGFTTYSNRAKEAMLGVPGDLLAARGAVDADVARAMAEGALARSRAQIAAAITGIAGPDGGSAEKPVGLVHFAAAVKGGETVARARIFAGDRDAVRLASVREALAMLAEISARGRP